jgi:signal peptidase I
MSRMAASAEGILQRQQRRSSLLPLRAVKRALHSLLVLVLVLAAIALGTVVVSRALGYGTLAVLSGSMGRSAPTGSLVIGSWHTPAEIGVGDVILVRRQGRAPVLHRVISRASRDGKTVVRLKGDANPAPDPESFTLPGRVLQKEHAIPFVGYAVGALRMPAGWILLVGLPTILLAFLLLRDVWRPKEAAAPALAVVEEPEVDAAELLDERAADLENRERELRFAAESMAVDAERVQQRELALAEAEASVAARVATIEQRENEIRIAEEAAEQEPPLEEEPQAHLVFSPGPTGYTMLEHEGPTPPSGAVVERDGVTYTVSRVGRSPLPGDARRCAYLLQL